MQGSSTDHTTTLAPGKLPGDLLARLISQYRTAPDPAVIVDAAYGFDAAALKVGDATLLVKSDPITFATEGIARYLVAVNANDIACMGGVPRWLTVVGLLPEGGTTVGMVERLFAELQAACTDAGVSLIGGHTEITLGLDRPLLIGTMLGTTGPWGLLKPGHAHAGDLVYVSKTVGIEGTALLASERRDDLASVLGTEIVERAAALLISPGIAISADARAALSSGAVTALHDPTEGGLATAVHEMAEASGLGVEIDASAVPLLPETRAICDHYDLDPLGLLSSGALLIAARAGHEPELERSMAADGIPVQRIGTLTERAQGVILVDEAGTRPLRRFDADELTRVL
jgi:hydrogenase expression/formation protein HypE